MGERQTAALRPEQDQGAPREAWRVSTSRPPAGCTPPPVSRVPCRELPLSLRASSERGAVGRVRRRKDKSTSFSGFPSPAPPQRPTWLLQALTQKQLPSLRTHGVAERCRAVWLESGKPGRGFPSASFHGMSGCLCSAQLEEAREWTVAWREPRGPKGPGQAPAQPAGRGGAGAVGGQRLALLSSVTLEWSLHLHSLCDCQALSLVLPFDEAFLQDAVFLKPYSVEYGIVLAYWFMQDTEGLPCTSH